MLDSLRSDFAGIFGTGPAAAFFAPGRVNLIGEHIDYNGGLVMPCAITPGTWLLTAPNDQNIFRFRSLNFDERSDVPLKTEYYKPLNHDWYNYPIGVIDCFVKDGKVLQGLDLLYYGDLPIGASLSSSASIEIVTAFAFNELFGAKYAKLDLVKLCVNVENDFMGLSSGVMDQFAVAFGAENKALKLNCVTLDYEEVAINLGDHVLAIINSNKPRKLTESKYNERVGECQEALTDLQSALSIENLCEIDPETFEKHRYLIKSEVANRRAEHVVYENDRVKQAFRRLSENKLNEFGRLMFASHESLKNLYEVSGKELDTIVEFCSGFPEVTGARMTGAGFSGCAIALVKESAFDGFSKKMGAFYTKKIGYSCSVYRSVIGGGVRRLF